MAELQSTNVIGSLCVNGVAIGGGKDYQYCCFTGSTTWTPTSDLVSGDGIIRAHVVGAGGGGGGQAGWVIGSFGGGPCPTRTQQAIICPACNAAAGQFIIDDKFITSTDACTVTIGAGGTGGEGFIEVTSSNITEASASIKICNTATDGGDTTFGGFTAYGGCGGISKVSVRKGCGENQNAITYLLCDTTTLTNSGAGGAMNAAYKWEWEKVSTGFCTNNQTGASFRPTACRLGSGNCTGSLRLESIASCKFETSVLGIEGVSCNRRCGVVGACHWDGQLEPGEFQNGAKTSETYGNGGIAGGISTEADSRSTATCGVASGSAGSDGIVVLQWME